jgi:hypothetical protein
MSNQELADALHMSAAMAKTHVSRVLMKLEARDRAQLVVIAYETGLARPVDAFALVCESPRKEILKNGNMAY